MNFAKVLTSTISKGARAIKVIVFGRADVKTPTLTTPWGVNGRPVENKNLIALYARTGEKGENVVIGYIDRKAVDLNPGETRLHSTNAAGEEKAYVKLRDDCGIELNGAGDNVVRFERLEAEMNNLRTQLNNHEHLGNMGANTSPPVMPITLNISLAKVVSVRVPLYDQDCLPF